MPLYYTDKRAEAVALAKQQKADGWTKGEVIDYWSALGYDLFFIQKLCRDAGVTVLITGDFPTTPN